jgi:long-subunit acyl-CoA synthetase (AMP-forming)
MTMTEQVADVPALGARTMVEAFRLTADAHPDRVAARTPDDGVSYTFAEVRERAERLAAGLHGLGLRRGDTFGIMLVNRPEFHVVDLAALHVGATPFSIYNTSAPEQIEYLFGDAGTRIALTERQFIERVLAARDAGTPIDTIILLDADPDESLPAGVVSLAQAEAAADADFDLEASVAAIEPSDVLTLIYTSGTTGPPKGVMLTHANLLGMIGAMHKAYAWPEEGSGVSFLPSAHIADRWGFHYASLMTYGYTITACADPKSVMQVVGQVRPTFFGAVPRIWEKLKAGLEAMVAGQEDPAVRAKMEGAIQAAIQKVRLEQAGEPVPDALAAGVAQAEEQLFAPLRARLGLENVQWSVVGAAPTPLEVLEFFAAIGLPPCEVWGMSETSAISTMNTPDAMRLGTVGRPIPGVELRLAEDGELFVKGPNVMKGYRGQPEKTAECLSPDGWLATGDIAEIDDDGFVRIVDRKKELIINAAGKNMSPANIEARIKAASPLIGQAVCIGDARPYNVALIALDPDGAAGHDPASAETRALITEAVELANSQLSRVEQIKKFTIVQGEWQPGGDELTPTMKLKRKPIGEKYAAEIEELYA